MTDTHDTRQALGDVQKAWPKPTRFDRGNRATWPDDKQDVLCWRVHGRRWWITSFNAGDDAGGWWQDDLWLPLPPSPYLSVWVGP